MDRFFKGVGIGVVALLAAVVFFPAAFILMVMLIVAVRVAFWLTFPLLVVVLAVIIVRGIGHSKASPRL